MKTKYGIILLLIGIVAFSANALAVDFTFKTNVTRTESRSIVPDNSPNCDGSTPTMPTINYDVTLIDSVFTQFSIKVIKKSDNSLYHGPFNGIAVSHGGNFNLATGELTHTITGITKTSETLIVQFFKSATATGTPYAEQEFSVSSDTRAKAGYVTFGNVGGGDGVNPPFLPVGAISGYGGIITGASIVNDNRYSDITVNFTALDDANYIAMVTVIGTAGNRFNDNNINPPVVYDKATSSFKIFLEKDVNNSIQNLRLDIIIQAY